MNFHAQTHPHCTSLPVSRRRFLKAMLALGGFLLLPSGRGETASQPPLAWWMRLSDGLPHALSEMPPPMGKPGSVMKLVAATALLEERLIGPDDRLECRGTLERQGRRFYCQHPHGRVNLREALGMSCNLYFVQAVQTLSAKRFLDYTRRFDLHRAMQGERFQFPQAVQGGQASLLALGLQPDFQPSALQMLNLSALTARRAVPDVRPQTWELLHAGMRMAVTGGTARELDPADALRAAAKTGTAPHGQTYQSWVVGFFPGENPRYAFCVRSPAGTARETAVPRARDFLAGRVWP